MYVEEELPMVGGREFQTVGAATLKPREAKVVLAERRTYRSVVTEKRAEISRL